MRLDVTCSTDDKYLQHCAAMLCSLFENNQEHDITVHLLHHGLSQEGMNFLSSLAKRYGNSVRFYDVDITQFKNVSISGKPNLSKTCYFRILLSSLVSDQVEKILYLDCDVIVLKDVSTLFQLDLENYGVAAVEDVMPGFDYHRNIIGIDLKQTGFCSGVLMINLKYWREHDCEKHMLDFGNRMGHKLWMEDQDILNHEFRGHWFKLPYKYMKTPMSIASLDLQQRWADLEEYAFDPVIIHYAAHVKPWLDIPIPDGKYYWEYVKRSGFPNPKVIKTLPQYRRPIRMAKVRYYLNAYIHPFVPDIVEMILRDLVDILVGFSYLFRPSAFKAYRIRRWLRKYK